MGGGTPKLPVRDETADPIEDDIDATQSTSLSGWHRLHIPAETCG